ncbi:Uncharacterized protein TCM_025352 [Theobroma cacao]|uniref:Reverse transcriptase zinc-binding domain-containing protein n=1 Tax=Theobroma cacao TaxID=3641 RepID=A0A061EZ83_THECC|nr:Uncharacterized protein TCM_025352 [Theobroma cacao]
MGQKIDLFDLANGSQLILLRRCRIDLYGENGLYFAKSFFKQIAGNVGADQNLRKMIWANLASPQVEVLYWQVLKGKLVVSRGNNLTSQKLNNQMRVVRGCLGEAEISGVLKDNIRNIKILFSKSMGIVDSNLVEIVAIKEVFLLYTASSWACTYELIIELDSSNVVKWSNMTHLLLHGG